MVKIRSPDADGEYPPPTVINNRHEAWAWDEEKRIRFDGKQKARPIYFPTYLESFTESLLRPIYFGKEPKLVVMDRIKAKQRHSRLQAEHDEKHASVF